MKDEQINEVVKSYYQGQTLRPEKCAELLALAQVSDEESKSSARETKEKQNSRSSFYPVWLKPLAIAASVLFLFFSFGSLNPNSERDVATLGQDIAQEIYLNHAKNLAIEYEADNYLSLQAQMEKLDFRMLASSRLSSFQYRVIGGRYCTIQGQIASQIKLQNKAGDRLTLYQTKLVENLKPLLERKDTMKGVLIEQWQEDGVFFGLARVED